MTTTPRKPFGLTRRTLLSAAAAVPLCSLISRRGYAAEFAYKLATGQDPTHPVNKRAQEAAQHKSARALPRMAKARRLQRKAMRLPLE